MASPSSSSNQPRPHQTPPAEPESAAAAAQQSLQTTTQQDAGPAVETQESKPPPLDVLEQAFHTCFINLRWPVGCHLHESDQRVSNGCADIAECIEKQKKYETLYARRLKAKYFSKRAFNGGDIFDHETTIDNEIIKSSRWPCTRSFADPIHLGDPSRSPSSAAETSAAPLKKCKKSC